MENINAIPFSYSTFDFPPLTIEEHASLRSPQVVREINQLRDNISQGAPNVGVMLNANRRDDFMKYLAVCINLIRHQPRTSFFLHVNNEDLLLTFLNAFSFHMPSPKINLRRFYCFPNHFFRGLDAKERVLCSLDIINSMEKIVTNPENPYFSFLDSSKIIPQQEEEDFFFEIIEQDAL